MAFDYEQALREALSPIDRLGAGQLALSQQKGQGMLGLAQTEYARAERRSELDREAARRETEAKLNRDAQLGYLRESDKLLSARQEADDIRREAAEIAKAEQLLRIEPPKGATLAQRRKAVGDEAEKQGAASAKKELTTLGRLIRQKETSIKEVENSARNVVNSIPDSLVSKAAESLLTEPSIVENLSESQRKQLASGAVTKEQINNIYSSLLKTFWSSTGLKNATAFRAALNEKVNAYATAKQKVDLDLAYNNISGLAREKYDLEKTRNDFILKNASRLPDELIDSAIPPVPTGGVKVDQNGLALPPVTRTLSVGTGVPSRESFGMASIPAEVQEPASPEPKSGYLQDAMRGSLNPDTSITRALGVPVAAAYDFGQMATTVGKRLFTDKSAPDPAFVTPAAVSQVMRPTEQWRGGTGNFGTQPTTQPQQVPDQSWALRQIFKTDDMTKIKAAKDFALRSGMTQDQIDGTLKAASQGDPGAQRVIDEMMSKALTIQPTMRPTPIQLSDPEQYRQPPSF